MIMFAFIFILIVCTIAYFVEETKTGKKLFARICRFFHI